MKRISGLQDLPAGLQRYLETHPTAHDWNDFRNFEAGRAYRELIETLALAQQGLCAFCEIRLTERDRQVEHFVPKSKEPAATFTVANLFAACIGGSNRYSRDPARYLPPVRENRSCGEYKGDRRLDGADGTILKPSELPPIPRIFAVNAAGRISVDTEACRQAKVAVAVAEATVKELNLDCRRLRNARAEVWKTLEDTLFSELGEGGDTALAHALEGLAEDYLLPDEHGNLVGFFTTVRCYFGAIGESVLQRQSAAWV